MVAHSALYTWFLDWWDFLSGGSYHIQINPLGWAVVAGIFGMIIVFVALRKR